VLRYFNDCRIANFLRGTFATKWW